MANPEPTEPKGDGAIGVDYDRLDVAAIMTQIQKKLESSPSPASARASVPHTTDDSKDLETPLPDDLLEPDVPPEPTPGLEPAGPKQKAKKLLLKLMRPFFPLIRLLGLPLHQDIRATQKILHETNKRLDRLTALFHLREVKVDQRFHAVEENAEAASDRQHKAELRLDLLEARLDARIKDLDRSMEYVRLLHNLDHNLVVELTKLKVEFDTLKSKFRILEKDQEYLKSRERALEEKALR